MQLITGKIPRPEDKVDLDHVYSLIQDADRLRTDLDRLIGYLLSKRSEIGATDLNLKSAYANEAKKSFQDLPGWMK